MKKLFTLIAFIGFAFGANAQHNADLSFTLTTPTNGATIDTGSITLSGYVTNNGPAATKATDTITNFIQIDGNIISFGGAYLFYFPSNLGRVLNSGDTMQVTLTLPFGTFDHNASDTPRVLCGGVFAISNAADTIADPFTNNVSCANVTFQGTSAVANVSAQISSISMYPNPVRGQANLELNLNQSATVSVRVMDVVGREVYTQNAGKLDAGKHTFAINTDNFANGVYMYQVTVGDETKTGKFNVAK